ncbi:MAG TPA: 16S rRNA (guanine(966)-N(2))-methyltransferase RsmD [Candidatus Fraserbacteria bacterium]|nr:16S rRNA (guanine(966)-N(2))-methyltransferase RsmD [Candidatus Fraserbacteria bacterium]
MRIIAGSHRGRKLLERQAQGIRPMRAQVRAALFNILDQRLPGSRFLDLFAGTGSVGLEALSRGVTQAVFIDWSPEAVRLITDNLRALELDGRARVYHQEALATLAQLEAQHEQFDLIFIGPPYGKNLAHRALGALGESALLRRGGLVIVEIFKKEELQEQYGQLQRIELRRYGDNLLVFYDRSASEEKG